MTEINNSRKRNLQVASTGEDEEDLWVVDGQQRTATRDDEHGCALNSSVLFKRSGEAKALTSIVRSLNIRSREVNNTNFRQLAERWHAATAPSSAVHLSDMCSCIPQPARAPPHGMREDCVGGKKRERGVGADGDRDVGCFPLTFLMM